MSSQLFSTFIFFDLETTGLPLSGYHPRITELSLQAVERSDLIDDSRNWPVKNKLNLCFNPMIPIQSKAANITGLNAKLRRIHSSDLSDKNGDSVYCSDTLDLFRDFDYHLVSPDDRGLAILTSQVFDYSRKLIMMTPIKYQMINIYYEPD
ncbi:unnamed protein product [Rodentolepis nana]|uniref:Exonuclease domain-containing protein n=1 Tax=Rodentolepis nana TaxID=102285 RepID=A0A0R3T9D1_RODNA|nr:unnamed protein product [Rodentolepis nana]